MSILVEKEVALQVEQDAKLLELKQQSEQDSEQLTVLAAKIQAKEDLLERQARLA